MMSAQMLAAATNTAEAAAASQDSMKMLDAEAEDSRPPVVIKLVTLSFFTQLNIFSNY
jgi:hypothetical protein